MAAAAGEAEAINLDLLELHKILWGPKGSWDTFRRWSQGFVFSEAESTALVQLAGGPCAILAPIQAYMVKQFILSNKPDEFSKMSRPEQEKFLIVAMLDILRQCTKRNKGPTVIKICSFLELNSNNEMRSAAADTINIDIPSTSSSFLTDASTEDPIEETSEPELQSTSATRLDLDSDYLFSSQPLNFDDPHSIPPLEIMAPNPEKMEAGPSSIEPPVDIMFEDPQTSAGLIPERSNIFMHVRGIPTLDDIAEVESETSVNEQSPGCEIHASLNNLLAEADKDFELRMAKSPRAVNISEEITNETEYKFAPIFQTVDSTSHQNEESRMAVSTESVFTTRKGDLSSSSDRELRFKNVSDFHSSIKVVQFHTEQEVEEFLKTTIEQFFGNCGLLLFLYSVLMTKGVNELKSEIGDLSVPLIHEIYGYGSQSLVNLMLTGRAVQYVWDNDHDIGGLTLKGIDQQSDIGFVTLMEHMRYCTVGSFLKSPKYPIWVLGSETHLTVAFSFDKRLAAPEQPWETARRVFKRYDPEGSNFIHFGSLAHVLNDLGLVSDPEYIEVMRQKLDYENLGIVLLNNFLDEFYPSMKTYVPEIFTVWHYNGLSGSQQSHQVQYVKGHAVLLECDIKSGCESDLMLTCLQTKWPNIELQWDTPNKKPPSLN